MLPGMKNITREHSPVFTLIFLLPLHLKSSKCLLVDLPDWQYGEVNEGCKSWIWVMSTGKIAHPVHKL